MDLIPCVQCIMHAADEPIATATFKIGGDPVLLHPIEWPACTACGQHMRFVAQIPLRQPIELSTRFDMAYVFICPGEYDERGWLKCPTWVPNSGANAVILQSGGAPTPTAGPADPFRELRPRMRRVDEPTDEQADELCDRDDFDEIVWPYFKIGGTPAWVQDVEHELCQCCASPLRYVAQLPANGSIGEPLMESDLRAISERAIREGKRVELEKREHFDLSYCGCGYVFICSNECCAEGSGFLWQPG